jgi:hypothetical protein
MEIIEGNLHTFIISNQEYNFLGILYLYLKFI